MAVTTSILGGGVTINEISGSPSGVSQDLNGDGLGNFSDQFIELVNTSTSTVDISGWQIYENDEVKHTFAPGTTLMPGERITVVDSNLAGPTITNVTGQAVYSDVAMGPSALDVIALGDHDVDEYIILQGTLSSGSRLTDTINQIEADHDSPTQVGSNESFNNPGSGVSNQRLGDGEAAWGDGTPTPGDANVSCFAPGTLIDTPSGARPVEDFAPGDLVLTADGGAVPVRFNLCQSLAKRAVLPERLEPVKIAAGALGGGLPRRDLVITADHGMILDELVINAAALVNGNTIAFLPHTQRVAGPGGLLPYRDRGA